MDTAQFLDIYKTNSQENKLKFINNIYSGKNSINRELLLKLIQIEKHPKILSGLYLLLAKFKNKNDAINIHDGLKHSEEIVVISTLKALYALKNQLSYGFVLPLLHNSDKKIFDLALNLCISLNKTETEKYLLQQGKSDKNFYLKFKTIIDNLNKSENTNKENSKEHKKNIPENKTEKVSLGIRINQKTKDKFDEFCTKNGYKKTFILEKIIKDFLETK